MNGDVETESPPETWLRYAESDLTLMTAALSSNRSAGEVCFHAQQATEKALKALLELQQDESPRSHNLLRLHTLVDASVRPTVDIALMERLTELESQSRYPGDWLVPTGEEALWASELASTTVRAAQDALS